MANKKILASTLSLFGLSAASVGSWALYEYVFKKPEEKEESKEPETEPEVVSKETKEDKPNEEAREEKKEDKGSEVPVAPAPKASVPPKRALDVFKKPDELNKLKALWQDSNSKPKANPITKPNEPITVDVVETLSNGFNSAKEYLSKGISNGLGYLGISWK